MCGNEWKLNAALWIMGDMLKEIPWPKIKNFLGCICVLGDCVRFEERGWEVDILKLMEIMAAA